MTDFAAEQPLLVSGPRARRLLGIGATKYWEMVKAGRIETVDIGGRKMPTYSSLLLIARSALPQS